MAPVSFRVVIARYDEERLGDLIEEISAELDISESEAEDLLKKLPVTVARGLDEEDAEDFADVLEELGAKVRIVEVASRRSRRRRPLDEGDDEEDFEEEDEDRRDEKPRRKPKVATSQRLLIVFGMILVGLLIGVLIMASIGGLPSLSCDAGYRGDGANASLTQALKTFATRYARGFTPDDAVAHGNLSTGKRATLRESVAGPACYVWIGLSPQGSDLDLHLRQDGQMVTQDRGEDNFPVVRHCVSGPSDLEVDVEMFGGAGDWVVQRYVLGADPGSDPLVQMHKLYSSMFIANGEPVGEVVRIKQMGPGEERVVSLPLDSQWCYAVLAVSQPGSDLDMAMENPQGQKIAEDNATDNYPIVRDVCPAEPGEYKLRLSMFGGSSPAVYQVYRGKLGGMGGGGQSGSQAQNPAPLNIGGNEQPSSDASVATQDGASPTGDGGGASEPEEAQVETPSPTKTPPSETESPPVSRNPSKK